ncbi:hypothetical protein DEO72_LG4g654 [Vigna unguiculata]|uniref:Uncharacterized protein n=1 Tax=Vigna unguiculata TaxID=3917 RepID=A0A4D6LMK8_VIGUN|nr:hypothetical protein DEO72_LG4g654 [Vigna unguiculata]
MAFHLQCKTLSLVLLFVYLLLLGSCDAIRPGQTMKLNQRRDRTNQQGDLPYHTMVFNFFPKGPVPPSGPSKRHNSVLDSTPNN